MRARKKPNPISPSPNRPPSPATNPQRPVTPPRDCGENRSKTLKPLKLTSHFAIGAVLLLLLSALGALTAKPAREAPLVLLEAEQFANLGGWVVDQQFMDQMGSPYLLAHGLGEPVRDAETAVQFPAAGNYRVWVRTRDWVAPWKAPGAPGRFQVLVNGKPLSTTFGTEGAGWHWQDGGTVSVSREAKVALHDLTGFEGRCDAILFARDLGFKPPNEPSALAAFRRQALGLPEAPEDGGSYDLIVVGGGIAGTSAALSAARLGLKVALLQDRPLLGGNNSSEVRVWLNGGINLPPYPRIGDIVAELEPKKRAQDSMSNSGELYEDERRLALVRSERNIALLLEQRVNAVESTDGVIRAVVAQHIRTARRMRLSARWFADCTGDGAVGAMAGADYDMTQKQHMGPSNLWNVQDAGQPEPFPKCECEDTNAVNMAFASTKNPAPFPRCPWALDLRDKNFPGRQQSKSQGANDPLNKLGSNAIASNGLQIAEVQLLAPAAVILQQPAAADVLLAGQTLNAGVVAGGAAPFTYQWYNVDTAEQIPNATNATLTVTNVQTSANYNCVVGNSYGAATSATLHLTVVTPTPYDAVVMADKPLAFFPLSETNGATAFDYVNGYNGTYLNGPSLGVPGPSSYLPAAAGFDGVSQSVLVPDTPALDFGGQLTLEAWVQAGVQGTPCYGTFGHYRQRR